MTALGVFRDDFYNAMSVLTSTQLKSSTQNGGVLAGANMVGASDCYAAFSGQTTAQSITTDTAVNIIAALQAAVATQYQAQITSFGAGVNPPPGVPNLFNVAYTLTIINNNTSSGAITLAAGTGVTLTAGAAIAISTAVEFVVSVLSPTTVSITRVSSKTV